MCDLLLFMVERMWRCLIMKKNLILTAIMLIVCFISVGCTSFNKTKQRADEIVNNYNAESFDYDTAVSKLNRLLGDTDDYDCEEYIRDQLSFIDKLKISKQKYNQAEDYYNGNKYQLAISSYSEVIQEDDNYASSIEKLKQSQSKYLDTECKKAEIYLQDEKYIDAVNIYKAAQKVYDDGSLDDKILEAENKYKEKSEKEAKTFEDEKDWASAIKKYKELQEYFDNNSYEVEIVNDQNNCVKQAVAESEEKLKEGDYSKANTILTVADSIVPNNKDISEQLDRVKEYTPVRLTDLTPFCEEDDGYSVILDDWTAQDTDNMGVGGNTGIKISSMGSFGNWGSITYNIEGKYDTLTGEFAIHEDFKDNTDTERNWGQVAVFDDNDNMIYCSEAVLGGVKPQDVNVDISGIQQLKVAFYIGSPTSFGWGYSAVYGFINPILYKDYRAPGSSAKNTKGESTDKNQTKKKETTIIADSDDYIIPDSSTRLITEEDITGLNNDELCLARNEIYARKGRKFKDDDIREYFEGKDWYNPTIEADDFTDDKLSDIEKKNVKFIKSYEK